MAASDVSVAIREAPRSIKKKRDIADKDDGALLREHRAPLAHQGRSWLLAALIVVAGFGIAFWLNGVAAKVDRDTLDRGADAVSANIGEQIRILSLAGTGAQSLAGQSLGDMDLAQIANRSTSLSSDP